MNLGDQVQFSVVAGKKQVRPHIKEACKESLTAPLTGIVTEVGRVYSVDLTDFSDGTAIAPYLYNPRTVFIVAVSLTERYKVFPEDIKLFPNTPSVPPQVPFPPQQPAPQPQTDLQKWIEEAVDELVLANEEFTAWNVTLKVRTDHPGETVFHADVKGYVHDYMGLAISNGTPYDFELRPYGNGQAFTYFPL